MICRYCKQEIEDGSIFCRFCGEKLSRSREKGYKPPKPRQMSDGRYSAQVMIDGKRIRIYGDSKKDYEFNVKAYRNGILEAKKNPSNVTLGKAIDDYINENTNVLSPSTIMGYRSIRRTRFQKYMDKYIDKIKWQTMINEEAKMVTGKTIYNAWGLVTPALKAVKYDVPDVNLPPVKARDMNFLDFEEIQKFLKAAKGDKAEVAVILALHSLRMSEIIALNADDIKDDIIHVNKAIVMNDKYKRVERDVNKTYKSTRDIPIMIPRLKELLPESGKIVKMVPNTIQKHVISICDKAGLEHISPHDLRRSFASLAYHLNWKERSVMKIGGWSNMSTVHKIYIKISQADVNEDVETMKNYYNSTQETKMKP